MRHEAFTSWLESQVKTQNDSGLRDRISQLSSHDEELESVIRKASQLVKSHSDDFEAPIAAHSGKEENEVFQLLLTEWNAYQSTSGGMGKAVIIENIKSPHALPNDGLALTNKATFEKEGIEHFEVSTTEYTESGFINHHISPLSGGTAIGAP